MSEQEPPPPPSPTPPPPAGPFSIVHSVASRYQQAAMAALEKARASYVPSMAETTTNQEPTPALQQLLAPEAAEASNVVQLPSPTMPRQEVTSYAYLPSQMSIIATQLHGCLEAMQLASGNGTNIIFTLDKKPATFMAELHSHRKEGTIDVVGPTAVRRFAFALLDHVLPDPALADDATEDDREIIGIITDEQGIHRLLKCGLETEDPRDAIHDATTWTVEDADTWPETPLLEWLAQQAVACEPRAPQGGPKPPARPKPQFRVINPPPPDPTGKA